MRRDEHTWFIKLVVAVRFLNLSDKQTVGSLLTGVYKLHLFFLIDFDCRVKRVAITERDNLKAYCGLWCSVAYG